MPQRPQAAAAVSGAGCSATAPAMQGTCCRDMRQTTSSYPTNSESGFQSTCAWRRRPAPSLRQDQFHLSRHASQSCTTTSATIS